MPAKRLTWPALALAAAVLLTDIVTKAAIVELIPFGVFYEVTPFFNIGHTRNPGAAFSFLADAGGWQRTFFIAVGLIASAVLIWLIWRGRASAPETIGYALILGGALANVVDRIFRESVVDWLDFYMSRWHWPAFNFADIAIVLGAAALIVAGVRDSRATSATAQQLVK